MEYILDDRDREVVQEILLEHSLVANKAVDAYFSALIKRAKLPPVANGYTLDNEGDPAKSTKLIPRGRT